MLKAAPRARAGFTLLEILVVVLVIGTLSTIAQGTYKRAIDVTRAANHRAALAALTTTVESYAGEHDARVPKAPVKDKAFTAAEVGLEDYITQGAMPPNPWPNTGAGHADQKVIRGTFFYATDQELTWISRPTGGVGTIETGRWPKLTENPPADAALPAQGVVTEVPWTGGTDMTGAVIYESDGSSYMMYGLGAIVPHSGTGNFHMLTGVRTNLPDKTQNQ